MGQRVKDIKLCASTINEATQHGSNLSNQCQRIVLYGAVIDFASKHLLSLWGYLTNAPKEVSLKDLLAEIKEARIQLKNLESEMMGVKESLAKIEQQTKASANKVSADEVTKQAPSRKAPIMGFIRSLGQASRPDYMRFKCKLLLILFVLCLVVIL